MYFGRRIPANKSTAQPSSIIVVDCESRPRDVPGRPGQVDHYFRLGHARFVRLEKHRPTRQDEIYFTDVTDFWVWVASKGDPKRPLWIWCHNAAADLLWLGLADLMAWDPPLLSLNPAQDGFWERPTKAQQSWKGFACLEDPPTMLKLMHRDGFTVNFLDLLNWLPFSLETVAGWCGSEKLPLPAFEAPDAVWRDRCERDTRLTLDAVLKVLKFVRVNDLGMFRWTLAQQGLAMWRHRFQDEPICPHGFPAVTAFEREGYFGGSNDLLYKGLVRPRSLKEKHRSLFSDDLVDQRCYGPIHELDCTSLYTYLCSVLPLPSSLLDMQVMLPARPMRPDCLAEDCLAEVRLETWREPFPVRCQEGIAMPLGEYWTVLAGPELKRALEAGLVTDVRRWCRYKLTHCLRSYMEACLDKRHQANEEGNEVESKIWKMLGNSLPGKFGQRPSEWHDNPAYQVERPWTYSYGVGRDGQLRSLYRSVGWLGQEQGIGSDPSHTFVALPAFVTSYAREHMRHLASIAGAHQVLYACADALYVTDQGLKRLDAAGWIADNVPGSLRIEHTGSSADFRGIGWLRLGKLWKRAGIPKNARITGASSVEWSQWDGLENSLFGGIRNKVRVTECNQRPPGPSWRHEVLHEGWIDRLTLREPPACPYQPGEVRQLTATPTRLASG